MSEESADTVHRINQASDSLRVWIGGLAATLFLLSNIAGYNKLAFGASGSGGGDMFVASVGLGGVALIAHMVYLKSGGLENAA